MYILAHKELGEAPQPTAWRSRSDLRSQPQSLRFMNLDQFKLNKASLTPRLMQMVKQLAKHVQVSWKTMRPIGIVRLIGHTDNRGKHDYNVKLGTRRARVVKAALEELLKEDILNRRIAIFVEKSPGALQSIADNQTEAGRAANRRVEVFIELDVLPSASGSVMPADLWRQAQEAVRRVEEEAERRRQQQKHNRAIPSRPPGKSVSSWLDEQFSRLPKKWRERTRDLIVTGACASLEMLLGSVVGQLSEAEKEGLRTECRKSAKKPT